MKFIKKKLPASTLPEVLISIVIILAVFTIAITIYTRITFSGSSLAGSKVRSEMQRIIEEADLDNKELTVDSIIYTKQVESHPVYRDLYMIRIEAHQDGKIIGKMGKVLHSEIPAQ